MHLKNFTLTLVHLKFFKKWVSTKEQGGRCYLISANEQIESWRSYGNHWAGRIRAGPQVQVSWLLLYTVSEMTGAHLMILVKIYSVLLEEVCVNKIDNEIISLTLRQSITLCNLLLVGYLRYRWESWFQTKESYLHEMRGGSSVKLVLEPGFGPKTSTNKPE